MPSTTDLTAPGTEYDDPNGLIVQYTAPIGAGTGNYNTFLSIQSNTSTESGFNHDLPPSIDDEGQGPHTHALQIGNLGTAEINGITYYVFRLDVNEPNTAPDQNVTLTNLTFFGSTSQATVDPTVNGSGFTQILSLDDPLNLTDHSSGSGTDDYLIFLPKDAVDTALGPNDSADFLTVFATFSGVDGGFEEFRALPGTPVVTEAAAIGIVKDTLVFDTSVAQTLTDNVSVEGKTVLAGTELMWTYTVANGGNVAIPGGDFTVTDSQGVAVTPVTSGGFNVGDTNHDGNLDVNEQWIYVGGVDTAGGTAAIDGAYSNIGTANGEFDPGGPNDTQLFATDPSGYTGVTPEIHIEKVTNVTEGTDTGTVDGTGSDIFAGAALTWTYTVTNPNADVPLSNVSVTDDNGTPGDTNDDFQATYLSGDANNDGILENGETWIFGAPAGNDTVAAIHGSYTNTAVASGSFTDDIGQTGTATESDTSGYTGVIAGITIDKTTSGIDPLGNPVGPGDGIVVGEGTTVTWHYDVTNNGDIALNDVIVVDDNGTPGPLNNGDDFGPAAVLSGGFNVGDANQNGLLDPGETWQFTASGPALTGVAYTNVGSVSGDATDAIGHEETVTASDSSSYTGFSPRTGELTIGYWYNHDTQPKHGGADQAEGAWTPFLVHNPAGAPVGGDSHGLYLLLGDENGDLTIDNGETGLYVAFDAAKELINSSQTANDTRQILLSQAIATQLNIDSLALADGHAHSVYAPNGLITDAVQWLNGTDTFTDGSTGNVDVNHDGFVSIGTDYLTGNKPHHLAGTTLTSSSDAWNDVTITFNSTNNGTFVEDGEAIKNALMYYNQAQLTPDLTGQFVEWVPTSNITTNGVNDFWQVIP